MMQSTMKCPYLLCMIGVFALICGCQQGGPITISAPPAAQPNTALARQENDRAYALIEKHNDHEAEQLLLKAIEADVTFGPAHNNLGLIYYRQGRYYEAAWEFYNATRLMPYQPDARNNLGMVLELDASRYDQAIEAYEKARQLAPDNPQYLANLARAKDKRGDRDDEMVRLLQELAFKDARPDWRDWARMKLYEIAPRGNGNDKPATLPSAR